MRGGERGRTFCLFSSLFSPSLELVEYLRRGCRVNGPPGGQSGSGRAGSSVPDATIPWSSGGGCAASIAAGGGGRLRNAPGAKTTDFSGFMRSRRVIAISRTVFFRRRPWGFGGEACSSDISSDKQVQGEGGGCRVGGGTRGGKPAVQLACACRTAWLGVDGAGVGCHYAGCFIIKHQVVTTHDGRDRRGGGIGPVQSCALRPSFARARHSGGGRRAPPSHQRGERWGRPALRLSRSAVGRLGNASANAVASKFVRGV